MVKPQGWQLQSDGTLATAHARAYEVTTKWANEGHFPPTMVSVSRAVANGKGLFKQR